VDLATSIDAYPATAFWDAPVSIAYRVRNLSANAAPAEPWVDVVYLSLDDRLDRWDMEVGRVSHTVGLAAGGEYAETAAADARDTEHYVADVGLTATLAPDVVIESVSVAVSRTRPLQHERHEQRRNRTRVFGLRSERRRVVCLVGGEGIRYDPADRGSTSEGTNTQTGEGLVRAVNIDPADPGWMTVVGDLRVPGTNQILGIAIDGTIAFVTANSGNFKDTATDFSFTGDTVVGTLDITDPRAPTLIGTRAIGAAPRVPGRPVRVEGGLFACGGGGGLGSNIRLHLADTSDPTNPVLSEIEPFVFTGVMARLAADSEFIYAPTPQGVVIYRLQPGAPVAIPAVARARIPLGTGVILDEGSFSKAPRGILRGVDYDTVVWDVLLAPGSVPLDLGWRSTIVGMLPGESREVVLDTTIDYELDGVPGQLVLPPQRPRDRTPFEVFEESIEKTRQRPARRPALALS